MRPVYGRVLDGPYSEHHICDVSIEQRTIYLAVGKDKLSAPTAQQELMAISDLINKRGADTVVIEGHADEPGGRIYNLEIAARRATAVANFLLKHNKGTRLRLFAVGANCPQRQGLGAVHVKGNRRVTIKIIKGSSQL
ncbi:OmpA family protein [Rhizobium leguminosarum bv. viciae]|nr:OmpA family protein [Rhizobium leguminosarum bv. viciae]